MSFKSVLVGWDCWEDFFSFVLFKDTWGGWWWRSHCERNSPCWWKETHIITTPQLQLLKTLVTLLLYCGQLAIFVQPFPLDISLHFCKKTLYFSSCELLKIGKKKGLGISLLPSDTSIEENKEIPGKSKVQFPLIQLK